MSTPNWGLLVSQGRAKAYGVSWSDKEILAVVAIASLPGVSREKAADYVRRGCESVSDYEKMVKADSAYADKNGELPIDAMDRGELQRKVDESGVQVTPDVPTETLRKVVADTKKPAKKVAKKITKK